MLINDSAVTCYSMNARILFMICYIVQSYHPGLESMGLGKLLTYLGWGRGSERGGTDSNFKGGGALI